MIIFTSQGVCLAQSFSVSAKLPVLATMQGVLHSKAIQESLENLSPTYQAKQAVQSDFECRARHGNLHTFKHIGANLTNETDSHAA